MARPCVLLPTALPGWETIKLERLRRTPAFLDRKGTPAGCLMKPVHEDGKPCALRQSDAVVPGGDGMGSAMLVTSDPYAWLRPIYARLQAHPPFRQFAPSHQFEQLVQEVEQKHPLKAATVRGVVRGCSARATRSSRFDDRAES